MVALPEIAFALCRNPAVAVGLPIALGVASGFVGAELRSERTGQAVKTSCSAHPAYNYISAAVYGLMGYASHLTVQAFDAAPTPQSTDDAHASLALYYASLALNLVWVPLYAGQHATRLALVDSVVLTAATVATAVKMHDLTWTNVSTSWFLAPVCAWFGYQTFVNARQVWNEEERKPKRA